MDDYWNIINERLTNMFIPATIISLIWDYIVIVPIIMDDTNDGVVHYLANCLCARRLVA